MLAFFVDAYLDKAWMGKQRVWFSLSVVIHLEPYQCVSHSFEVSLNYFMW